MSTHVPESKEVYRVIERATGAPQYVYSQSCHDEVDFDSVEWARSSNCHDVYKERDIYAVAKYRVTYELLDPDVDGGADDPPKPRPKPGEDLFDFLWEQWKQMTEDAELAARTP